MEDVRWWTVRRAQSGKPATYTCPFCGRRLHASSEHVLVAPEGDMERRRHAHLACARAARLPTLDDWRRQNPRPTIVERLWTRLRR